MAPTKNCDKSKIIDPRILLLLLALILITPSISQALPHQEGNLEHYLKAIDYGKRADQSWTKPSAKFLQTFADVFEAFLDSNYKRAHRLGKKIGYQVIEFVDNGHSPVETHYMLQEKTLIGSPSYKGAGIFVTKTAGKPIAIEAPHPQSDLYTELQAIELYIRSPSRFLFIAGSRRNSSTSSSACSGNYFASDAVHNTMHTYFVAHKQLAEFNPETLFLQLHGFGSSSLTKLQTQCQTSNENIINLSPGLKYYPNGQSINFIDVLAASVNNAGQTKACIYGRDTGSLGGTTNTTGRFSNHSDNACTEKATQFSDQFIHIEQSFPVRASYGSLVNDQILDAIEKYYENL